MLVVSRWHGHQAQLFLPNSSQTFPKRIPFTAIIVNRVCTQCDPIGQLIFSRSVHKSHVRIRALLGLTAADIMVYQLLV